MPQDGAPKRPGRPRNPAKHAAILQAAGELFMRLPFEAVSMDAVAAAAGVSKMTLYAHFGDKESLFVALVSSFSDRMLAAPAEVPDSGGLAQRLEALGKAFLCLILSPPALRMRQALSGALRADPALAERFYEAGPGRTRRALAAIIADGMAGGTLRPDDPLLAAEDLLSLWIGDLPGRLAIGLAAPTAAADLAARARRGTGIFLRAYGLAAASAAPPGDG